ncbi:hypothetical protein [Streptomyces sp. NPDC004266]|uniref:hypothetical protein n=1 Tax=Streptomyces sp. NPDC004266 TaxID=3364693 RepID=UPI0036AD8D8D
MIHEPEWDSSWAEIGQYPGAGPTEAEERSAAALDGGRTAFDVPYRLHTWAGNRLVLVDDEHPVGSGLVTATPKP